MSESPAQEPVVAFVASYPTEEVALLDYAGIRKFDAVHDSPMYDVALVGKDDSGKLHIKKKEKAAKAGAWIGAAAGGLIGLVVPPVFLAEVALGATTGGLIGHFKKGLSRDSVEEIGAMLQKGAAAIVFVHASSKPLPLPVSEMFTRATDVASYPFDADTQQIVL